MHSATGSRRPPGCRPTRAVEAAWLEVSPRGGRGAAVRDLRTERPRLRLRTNGRFTSPGQ